MTATTKSGIGYPRKSGCPNNGGYNHHFYKVGNWYKCSCGVKFNEEILNNV